MGFVFSLSFSLSPSLSPGRSDLNRRLSAPVHLYTNTSLELVWSFQSKKHRETPDTGGFARLLLRFHHLTLFEKSESYFSHYVNTSKLMSELEMNACAWPLPLALPLSRALRLRQMNARSVEALEVCVAH